MDSLVKQLRGGYSGIQRQKTEEAGNIRDGRIPPQQTQSFKATVALLLIQWILLSRAAETETLTEKKKSQNWFQRLFNRQMSQDYDSSNIIEHVTAVAAATFAIATLEEPDIPDQKKTSERPETSFIRSKSNKEDTTRSALEPGRASKRFSGETSMRLPEGKDTKVPETAAAIGKTPQKQKSIGPAPSMKKTPTFAENLKKTDSIQPETAAPKPDLPATINLEMPPTETQRQSSMRAEIPLTETRRQSSMRAEIPPTDSKGQSPMRFRAEETEAEAWEKAELAKIKERYEKINSTILSWEEKKKAKARRRLDKTQSEVERRRVKALEKFRIEMEYINQVAGAAKVQAEERRKDEELKAKEKANIIRTTGKVPKTCLCL
ncbi:remorin 1.4-like [Quercus lobata]|uniref:remorin 1.4-like n=1 Tax=Quercus lobata TaxID=97700 RepID=UPI00124776F8|nr:remorin 1.4-like [Quercus lobata]